MATIATQQARYLGNVNGLPPVMVGGLTRSDYVEAASQTFGAGSIVRPDATSGKIEVDATGVATKLFGQAMGAATGVTDTPVHIRIFRPGDLYVMTYFDNTAAGVTSQAIIGDAVAMYIVATTLLLVADQTGFVVTKPFGVIRDIYTKARGYDVGALGDVLGDTGGRVVVELQPGAYWGQSV